MNPMDLLNWKMPAALHDYPWREMEMDRAKSALLESLQRAQDEALKKQELERGMEEQKLKQEQLRQSMMARALQGWNPPPGTDVGQFSQGGKPMQYKAIGPGMGGPQNIQNFDRAWSQDPAQGELAEMIKRQLFFPKAEPNQLEFPQERAQRAKEHEVAATDRALQVQEEITKRAEGRTQKFQTQQQELLDKKAAIAEQAAQEKAYQTSVIQVKSEYLKGKKALILSYNKAVNDPLNQNKREELRKYFVIANRDLDAQHVDDLQQVEEMHGRAPARGKEDLVWRSKYAELNPETLMSLGVASFDQLKTGAEQAGITIDQAIELIKKHEKETKSGKSK